MWNGWRTRENFNFFSTFFFCTLLQLIWIKSQCIFHNQLEKKCFLLRKLLTSTMKRPAGSLSMAMSKNTRGNPIFLVAKLRRHNWIKLGWLAKWFWFSVCRRPIERACRHSVPATREAIFVHVFASDWVCACGKCECVDAQGTMNVERRKVNRYERILFDVCEFGLHFINAFAIISMFRLYINRIQSIASRTPISISRLRKCQSAYGLKCLMALLLALNLKQLLFWFNFILFSWYNVFFLMMNINMLHLRHFF